MRTQFSLFQTHLDLTTHYWKELIKPGDIVIDATCGNGKDTLKLALLALQEAQGLLYACDIQKEAIAQTQHYLTGHLSAQQLLRIQFILGCHSQFPKEIQTETVKLIVYNLGYLPKGNKAFTTKMNTTLQSLNQARKLVMPGGVISITCYPGHAEGFVEEQELIKELKHWSPEEWSCCYHQWLNRTQAPSLLVIQRKK